MHNHIPVLLTLTLSACNAETMRDAEFPVESVMVAQYQEASDVILYRPVENADTLITQNINTPQQDTTFNGSSVKSTKSVFFLKEGELELSRNEYTLYFQASPYKYMGSKSSDEYEVASSQILLPKTAKIGDSGKVYTSNAWSDDSKKTPTSDTVVNWTLRAANDNTAWLCEDIEVYYLAESKSDYKGSACVEINPQGEMLNHKVTVGNVVDGDSREIVFMSK